MDPGCLRGPSIRGQKAGFKSENRLQVVTSGFQQNTLDVRQGVLSGIESDRSFDHIWSGREDLNLRPLAPHASALAGLRHAPS
jgi:hypothetical protein